MNLRVLYQDEFLIAVDKPAGMFVHPPEDKTIRISQNQNCLFLLRKQVERYVHPVHRLDRGTSGVLLFAFDPKTAAALQKQLAAHEFRKTYLALVRGWAEDTGEIEREIDGKTALTRFETIYRVELPFSVGKFDKSRYSLLKLCPREGRTHQLRRHCSGNAHPIVGDTTYGDRKHNRHFRDVLDIKGLFLKAYQLKITHPHTEQTLHLQSRYTHTWHKLFDLIGFCPRFVHAENKSF